MMVVSFRQCDHAVRRFTSKRKVGGKAKHSVFFRTIFAHTLVGALERDDPKRYLAVPRSAGRASADGLGDRLELIRARVLTAADAAFRAEIVPASGIDGKRGGFTGCLRGPTQFTPSIKVATSVLHQ